MHATQHHGPPRCRRGPRRVKRLLVKASGMYVSASPTCQPNLPTRLPTRCHVILASLLAPFQSVQMLPLSPLPFSRDVSMLEATPETAASLQARVHSTGIWIGPDKPNCSPPAQTRWPVQTISEAEAAASGGIIVSCVRQGWARAGDVRCDRVPRR